MESYQPNRAQYTGSQNYPNSTFSPGMPIDASDGLLGKVDNVGIFSEANQTQYVAVRTEPDNQRIVLPANIISQTPQNGRLQVQMTRQKALENAINVNSQDNTQAFKGNEELRIPLVEEQLRVQKHEVGAGVVKVHKTVEEVEEKINVPIVSDDIEIQRVQVNQQLTNPVQTRQEGEWMIVPIMREVLVVEKRLMLVEEVRIRRTQKTEQKEIRDTVKQERLTIEKVNKNPGDQTASGAV